MDRMSEEAAAALTERMDGLIEAVKAAEDQVETNRALTEKTHELAESTHALANRLRVALVVMFVLVVGVVAGGLMLRDQAGDIEDQGDATVDQAVITCQNANKTRAGQRAIWQFFFEVTEAGAGPDAPEAVIDFYQEFLAWIETDVLADRDCDNLDAPIAEPGPPPSYRKALKEALAEEAAD